VAVILADSPPWVRVWLPARIVTRTPVGSSARVRVHGLDKDLTGRLIEVAREPEFTPHFALSEREREHLVYRARVEIVDAPPGLRPGLPAEVHLPGGEHGTEP
jgi:HlyD family secretion protein